MIIYAQLWTKIICSLEVSIYYDKSFNSNYKSKLYLWIYWLNYFLFICSNLIGVRRNNTSLILKYLNIVSLYKAAYNFTIQVTNRFVKRRGLSYQQLYYKNESTHKYKVLKLRMYACKTIKYWNSESMHANIW